VTGGRVAERLEEDHQRAQGRLQRRVAHRVRPPKGGQYGLAGPGTLWRGAHRLPVTALALSGDDSACFSASKDGAVVRWDVETGARQAFEAPPPPDPKLTGPVAAPSPWVRDVLSLAVSDDGRYVATGGREKRVHVWDARSGKHVKAFPGHRDSVWALAFREGSHELYSGGADRTLKVWNVDDLAYVDTLFGHQAEMVAMHSAGRSKGRAVSVGRDRTARVWKIDEDSHLILRSGQVALESCAFVSQGGGEFMTGSDDGSVALWSQMKKRPVQVWRGVHGSAVPRLGGDGSFDGDKAEKAGQGQMRLDDDAREAALAAAATVGSAGGSTAAWVGAVACARGADLAASGAGDGTIRLWSLESGNKGLRPLHQLPARGFVNALAVASTGKFVLAGMGQEPRLGRWSRDKMAANGVLLHRLDLRPESGGWADDSGEEEEEEEEEVDGSEDEDGSVEEDEEEEDDEDEEDEP